MLDFPLDLSGLTLWIDPWINPWMNEIHPSTGTFSPHFLNVAKTIVKTMLSEPLCNFTRYALGSRHPSALKDPSPLGLQKSLLDPLGSPPGHKKIGFGRSKSIFVFDLGPFLFIF